MKNVAASVRARLLNLSRSTGVPLASLMEQYSTGRFLYRLANSEYRERFVLKGAQLFRFWGAELHRPTRDLDLLGYGDASEASIKSIFTELLRLPVEPEDGLEWSDVRSESIRDEVKYGGVRAVLLARLAGARITLQVDVGFGDAITPRAQVGEWRELLDFPAARLLLYPPETVVAEKLEAAVSLGRDNSRMKDFFDLLWLCNHQSFTRESLGAAIEATFTRRGTEMPSGLPLALTPEFGEDANKNLQWNAFIRKGKLDAPAFPETITRIAEFLSPLLQSDVFPEAGTWHPETGWTESSS